jgi:flagellin-specific chaperone FliS
VSQELKNPKAGNIVVILFEKCVSFFGVAERRLKRKIVQKKPYLRGRK